MTKKIITRISNEIGNQLFMYASTFSIAKKLHRELLIDNETSFKSKKNISHYGLNNFTISSKLAPNKNKFLGLKGYLIRKLFKKIDFLNKYKRFYVEKRNEDKITKFDTDIFITKLSNTVYFEGYFETEKYFLDIKNEIIKEFDFVDKEKYKKIPYLEKLDQKNTVSICLRQNRFLEGKGKNNIKNKVKSDKFKNEQIAYINKSMDNIKNNIDNPTFFLWSNNLDNIDMSLFNNDIQKIIHEPNSIKNLDRRVLDLFLISKCNHHIVVPSSFNWWGAWLSQKDHKLVCRPSNNFFSYFKVNNLDFWPSSWKEIS